MRTVVLPGGIGRAFESGDPVESDESPAVLAGTQSRREALGWAEGKRAVEQADAADETVQSIIADLQALKAEVKAAPAGPLTLTRAQTLKLIRAVLWHIKGDKTA